MINYNRNNLENRCMPIVWNEEEKGAEIFQFLVR
jgi:hypothetical protein